MTYKLEKRYRLKGYDYSANGWYFVTICIAKFKPLLGHIKDEKNYLSKIGKITDRFWIDIPKQFAFIRLNEYVIMPNHLHGIIVINQQPCRNMINHVPTNRFHIIRRNDFIPTFENNFDNTNDNNKKCNSSIQNNPMKTAKVSLSKVIRWYKGKCTYTINKLYPNTNFKWQSRYFDRVIRDEEELERIREYIWNNPSQWEADRNYQKNISV